MLDLDSVSGVLKHLLDRVVVVAAEADHAIPDRRYTTTGGAVYDCPQVSVSANSISTGIAGSVDGSQPVGNCPPGWYVTLELAVVREAAEATQGRRGTAPPKTEAVETDTSAASADAAILTAAVESIAGPGWDQYGNVPASILFGEVQGGLTAVVMTVTVNIWDVPPAPPGGP